MPRTTFQARWVVPVASPPIENGWIVVEDGRITAVERAGARPSSAEYFGDAVILPGFVNAHTHLELTACQGRAPYRGSFVEWIKDVTRMNPHLESDEAVSRSVRSGLSRSMAAGVTTVADIGTGRPVVQAWAAASINVVGLLEVLGMGPKRFADHPLSVERVSWECHDADNHFREAARAEARGSSIAPIRRVGVAPHAPYSTDPAVYRAAVEFAESVGAPISTHLAETPEEEQFLRDGTGGFRELLEDLGLWDGSFTPPGCRPIEYADRIGLLACDPLLAHVNYATDGDLDRLASSRASVVYCPRSHRFFRHEPHRYRDMLARGINVCVGTDSLASNDSLSVLDELRFLRFQDEDTGADRLLAMATLAGARALKLDDEIGSLEVGKRADLVIVPMDNGSAGDPVEDLLAGTAEPVAVFVAGRRVHPDASGESPDA